MQGTNMRALLSVSDKTKVVELGRGLAARGYALVSTGGTARVLAEAGLSVTNVSEVTGFPEMMDGRVKTLHPAVHGGILARRDRPDDLDALERHRIRPIDVVAVNLYPFARAAARPETTFEALIEEIDIGGPSLVRAAAKNFKDVLVVVDPADYADLLQALDRPGGPTAAFRFELARKAFAHTAAYDEAIAAALSAVETTDSHFARTALTFEGITPDRLRLSLSKIRGLRYGENPHQSAAVYDDGTSSGFGDARILPGQRALVQQPRRPRRGRAVGARVRRARRPWSSSTPIRAARPSGAPWPKPTCARAKPIPVGLRGVVGLNRAIDATRRARSPRRSSKRSSRLTWTRTRGRSSPPRKRCGWSPPISREDPATPR